MNEKYTYQFIAGNLALDFINTVAYRFDPEKKSDHLETAGDVGRWAIQARLPDRDAINIRPPMSAAALRRVRTVREELFAIFFAIARAEPIPADALRKVGNALQECRAKQYLSLQGDEVRWDWRASAGRADILLYSIFAAAIDLLTSDSRALVRQCTDKGCGWLFLDRSNARKRRWCSMADCGNRNKAREHYRRAAGGA